MKEYIVQPIAQETIDSFDAYNAPELIRCKDCKHGEECVKPYKDYWCNLHEFYKYGNWFCADGERKD